MSGLQAPFPWFGGKRRVAPAVWAALGDVDNYVEPFAGSLAVLLDRPAHHKRRIETVNDLDHYIANFWRAIVAEPETVAAHADWPVNEADLLARHRWLVSTGADRIEALERDANHYDAKVAGWWVWGISAWIGHEWCTQAYSEMHKLPHLGDAGKGVHRQLPHLGSAGKGVHRKRPHLGDAGKGVHRPATTPTEWFAALRDRLRRVRVCCGDWSRVLTDGATSKGGTVGVFLDPPYDQDMRDRGCYNADSVGLSAKVREWTLSKSDDPRFRIALCGFDGEHEMPAGWRVYAWKTGGGYGNNGNGRGRENAHRERIWFSPRCVRKAALFD